MNEHLHYVSVIVPTYKDWAGLALCITALTNQDIPSDRFEILIANNDPDSVPPAEIKFPPNSRIIPAYEAGSYSARNVAIEASKGDILAFTDADCIPNSSWLSNALFMLQQSKDIDRIAGRIELFPAGGSKWAYLYERSTSFPQARYVRSGHCATANLITRRHIFDKIGMFNPSLLSGGDTEWNLRATAAGVSLIYSDTCSVRHPSRGSFSELMTKSKRVAGGIYTRKRFPFKYLVLGLLPPINTDIIAECNKLAKPAKNLIYVTLIGYSLKLYQTYSLLKLILGIDKPSRT